MVWLKLGWFYVYNHKTWLDGWLVGWLRLCGLKPTKQAKPSKAKQGPALVIGYK